MPFAKVGDAATLNSGSDCYPQTVTAVRKNGREIELTENDSTVVKGSMMDGTAEWAFGPANGRITIATWRASENGYRMKGSNKGYGWVNVGFRRRYYDPSF